MSEFQQRFFLTKSVFSTSTPKSTNPFFCEAKRKLYENSPLPTLDNLSQRVLFCLWWWAEYHGTGILLQNRTYALGDLCLNHWVCTPSYTFPDPVLAFLKCSPTINCSSKLPPWSGTLGKWKGTFKDNHINGSTSTNKKDRYLWKSSHLRKSQGLTRDCLQERLLCVLWT